MEININDLETAMRDFEIGDQITDVILLSKGGRIRRVIMHNDEDDKDD